MTTVWSPQVYKDGCCGSVAFILRVWCCPWVTAQGWRKEDEPLEIILTTLLKGVFCVFKTIKPAKHSAERCLNTQFAQTSSHLSTWKFQWDCSSLLLEGFTRILTSPDIMFRYAVNHIEMHMRTVRHCSPWVQPSAFDAATWREAMWSLPQLHCLSQWWLGLRWDSRDPTGPNTNAASVGRIYSHVVSIIITG